jgi:hypothetical protein
LPPRRLPEFRRGRRPAAVDLNDVAGEVARIARITVGPGLNLQDWPTGRHLALSGIRPVPILLSGSASPYTGVEAYRVGGAWAALPGGRSFPKVVEANAVSGLAGKVFEARLCGVDGSNVVEWCFAAVRRGVPTGPPTVTIPGCTACVTTPAILVQVNRNPACNPAGGTNYFPNLVYRYGTTPAGYAALSLGASSFLSESSFKDQNGDVHRWYFTCTAGSYTIQRVYLTSIFGSPFKDSIRYTWPLNRPANTCSPFALTDGVIYSGGDAGCDIEVYEGPADTGPPVPSSALTPAFRLGVPPPPTLIPPPPPPIRPGP